MSVEVVVLVRWSSLAPSRASSAVTMLRTYEFEPQIGDMIELLPERRSEARHVSAWHGEVARRYLGISENSLEVHVDLPRPLDAESLADLRAEGYRLI